MEGGEPEVHLRLHLLHWTLKVGLQVLLTGSTPAGEILISTKVMVFTADNVLHTVFKRYLYNCHL